MTQKNIIVVINRFVHVKRERLKLKVIRKQQINLKEIKCGHKEERTQTSTKARKKE